MRRSGGGGDPRLIKKGISNNTDKYNSKNKDDRGNSNGGNSKGGRKIRGRNLGGNDGRTNSNSDQSNAGGGMGLFPRICFHFQKTGRCRYGRNCKFLHDTVGQNDVNRSSRGKSSNLQGYTSGSSGGGSWRNTQDSNRLIKHLMNTNPNQLADVITRAGPLWGQCWGDASSPQMPVEAVEILIQTLAKVPFSQEAKVPPPPIHALSSAMKRYLTSSVVAPLLAAETSLNVVRKSLSFEWEEKKSVVKDALSQILEDAANKLQRRNQDHRDCMNRIDGCLDKLDKPWSIKEKFQGLSTKNDDLDGTLTNTEPGEVPHHHHSNWRNATIQWLVHSPTFTPSELPKMQGPSTKSQGVYKNRDHYFDTMQRLMIAMAFHEGHASLAPKCWERGGGGQPCGGSLIRLPEDFCETVSCVKQERKTGSGPLRCRGRGCHNLPVLVCKIASHSRGLCQRCANLEMEDLLGPTGSTHVYNGHVGRVDGASGKMYLTNFFSRKDQMDENGNLRTIHWRSTKRLAVPNLVGIVRLGDASSVPSNCYGKSIFYRALNLHDRIHWGEVCPHGNQQYEDKQRQQGNICVNLASPSIFEPDNALDVEHEFNEGDVVAVIDCMSFVPEYMPVIRAFEQQQNELLPFNDGLMLNLDVGQPADLTNTVLGTDAQNKAAGEVDFQKCIFEQFGCDLLISNSPSDEEDVSSEKSSGRKRKGKRSTATTLPRHLIQNLVSDMVASSAILPLREIRQNSSLSQQMQAELVSLLLKATLDFGQLVNFIDALRNPVHCTQGPPGTGKSYLGVQVVHALAIIRKYWMQQNTSVGTPPILVLSYKNHATDEFLVDLLKAMGTSLSGSSRRYNYGGSPYSGQGIQMVRMGNPGDPALSPFSEKSLVQQQGDADVRARQSEVHELQDLRRACQRAQRSATLFQSYQAEMFDTTSTALGMDGLSLDEIQKRQNDAAYEATEVLFAAIVRSHLLQAFSSNQQLQSIASVMNKDAPEDKKFRHLQQHGLLYQDDIQDSLSALFQGIQHYIEIDANYSNPHELLYMFLLGQYPKSPCVYKEVDSCGQTRYQCDQIAEWHDMPLCRSHRCVLNIGPDRGRCPNAIYHSRKGMLCKEHMCWYDDCDQPRIRIGKETEDGCGRPVVEKYCTTHACVQCVKLKISPAREALDEPPRNVCEEHPLCSVMDCFQLAVQGKNYCALHAWKQCEYRDRWGQQCRTWAISSDLPCCNIHVDNWSKQKRLEKKAAVPENQVDNNVDFNLAAALKMNSENRKCKGTNRKNKPCKGLAMTGSDFCEAHAPKDAGFKAKQAKREAEFRRLEQEHTAKRQKTEMHLDVIKAEKKDAVSKNDAFQGGESSSHIATTKQAKRKAEFRRLEQEHTAKRQKTEVHLDEIKAEKKDAVSKNDAVQGGESSSQTATSEVNDDGSAYGPPPDLGNVDVAHFDNMDEMDDGDGVRHIREIFEIESGDNEDDGEHHDEFQDALDLLPWSNDGNEGTQSKAQSVSVVEDTRTNTVPIKDPKDWSWSLSLDDRWAACQAFMHGQCEKLLQIQSMVKSELPLARKRLREAESRARAQVFENKTVIGGTIVGCITRLESIHATRPFAIIVEEASEVLEPLLFACLCQSTVKLELIGDHLQLQPNLMGKFDFMRINKVNTSMFERLICAPDKHRVPSGVLSIQRRMRRDVCDLTREYYKDIVAVEDHPICTTKTLPGQVALSSFWKGREVPGIRSHLFLWTHSGAQGRTDVGVSKQNKQEAQMCVSLAYYLVKCGCLKSSIAILTPYKGQLMLIRKLLLSDHSSASLLTRDPSTQNQVRLSTVDRFQGDESDVVIASLVVDEKSRTQFVKLQNRMIVLLSRARLGCFILGNTGYFDRAGGAKHWMNTFNILKTPPETSDNSHALITVNASAMHGKATGSTADTSSDITLTTTRVHLNDSRFTEARVGPTLPLCCPQHPLLSWFDARTANDLDLGFCPIACDEKLACSHQCGLRCHWPKTQQHNKNCRVLVDSPCLKHSEKLPCMDVYKNTTTSKQDTIEVALKHYQCPKKVCVTLPCNHQEEMLCWQEDEIVQGKASFPKCHRQSPTPFVFSGCGHELSVTCAKLEQYSTDKNCVAPCTQMVQFQPKNCTHVKSIKCYLENEYRTGKTQYVCPEKVAMVLPRCGHELKNIACSESCRLETWSGQKAEEVGIVREGVQYGPEDYLCRKVSKFVRICGHEETTICNTAFKMAKMENLDDQSPCLIRVPATNPHCGHPCTVSCVDAKKLYAIERLTSSPINDVHQGISPQFPNNLPLSVGRCTERVILHRTCGHTDEVACSAARGTVTRCKEEVTIRSPLCGHDIKVPCWRRQSIEAWHPWNEYSEDKLAAANVLPADAKPNDGIAWPDADVLSILTDCPGHVTVSKSCGHTYRSNCGELVSILHNGGKSKKGASCSELVTRELPRCGHEVTVMCNIWQNFVDKGTVIKCRATVERPCWNTANCSNIVSVSCTDASKTTATFCCPQRLEWRCKAGKHKHMLQLCMNGIPETCPMCMSDDITSFIDVIKKKPGKFPLPHVMASNPNSSENPELVKILETVTGWQSQASVEQCMQKLESKVALDTEAQRAKFFQALAQGLGKFQHFSIAASKDPFKRPRLTPLFIPIFFVLASKKKEQVLQEDGFIRTCNFVKSKTLNGIAVYNLTRDNMLSLANENKGSTKKTLICGYLFALRPKLDCNWPSGKKSTKQDLVRIWREVEGHDCMEFKQKGNLMKPIVVWDPAALYATYRVGPLDSNGLKEFAEDIGDVLGSSQTLQLASRTQSSRPEDVIIGDISIGSISRDPSVSKDGNAWHEEDGEAKRQELAASVALSLQGSWADLITFANFASPIGNEKDNLPLCLHSYSSQTGHDAITVITEKDLTKKLSFVNGDMEDPFGGKRALERRIKAYEKQLMKSDEKNQGNVQSCITVYQLLLALEIYQLGDNDRALCELENYCAGLQEARSSSIPNGAMIAHPLLLLAFSRIGFPDLPVPREESVGKSPDTIKLLQDFARYAPGMLQLLLDDDEMREVSQLYNKFSHLSTEDENDIKIASPADLWEELKDMNRVKSNAMEDLMKMTGLRRVKQAAVELFKQGIIFSRMDDKTRKLNAPSLNYVFLGNPGTGKTTVARLIAKILCDAGLRQDSHFEETSGQDLKEAGVDEFKKKVKAAMDGVLFIDEAYTLDPVGDKFKGGPVANELLAQAENERERLSFILAGYEDEISNQVFAFNPGFKSRFIEVRFEDFDEDELLAVWNGLREARLWREADDRLGRVVVRRLAKMKGRKGFGNARLVRQKLEEACKRAMAREDFDVQDLELRIADAIGENPIHNEKLQAVVGEFEAKTGWTKVKEQVRNLVNICSQNYKRELQGQEQLPVLLNRLFLGNPGTGKTTSARLYGNLLKELGFLSNGDVVEKTAGDLGGQVVGESKQKTVTLIDSCRGKVLMIDEAYGLNDSMYGKQALDALVEKVQGTEADDIAVLLLGYEEQMMEMLDNQNPGLRRRFAPDQAFRFEDYNASQLEKILCDCCKAKNYKPSLEFRERALKKLEMHRRSEPYFGNAGSVQNLLKDAVARATAKRNSSPDGTLKLEPDDVELPGDGEADYHMFAELDDLYQMETVREEFQKLKSQFDLADEEGEERPKLGHFVFSGAPGTGKTTVARSLGKMLHRCGLIARPEVTETSGLKLTGEHMGSTKKIVEEHLNKSKGGVLFIDEAYELGKGTFGSEACSALVEAMTNEDKYGGLVIVMAGYQADMQSMLDSNQGMKSRFKRFIEFRDWHPSDCTRFFIKKANAHNFSIENKEQSIAIIKKGFEKLKPLKGWGNARDVTKFYESVSENRAQRLGAERASGRGASLDKIFLKEDVSSAMDAMVSARMGTGGTSRRADANHDPFAELDKLYRMEKVKEKLQQLQNTYIVASHDGEDVPSLGHFIFIGSPGTGKTTVARIMSEILFDLELTPRRHVEETSGLKLQGQYMGQTKKIVQENLEKAKGGVLFIDEAYTLGQGSYGSEACDTLVAAMTDPQYAGVVVIIAGYPKDIDEMLASNAGLKSRFTHTLEFPDWEVSDCLNCLIGRAETKGFKLADKGVCILQNGFEQLRSLNGFGNARDVDEVWKATLRYRADRVVTGNVISKGFEESDIQQAVDEMIKSRTITEGKVTLTKKNTFDHSLQPACMGQEDPYQNIIKDAPVKMQSEEQTKEVVAQEIHEEAKDAEVAQLDEERDPGVSDAVWTELQIAKQAEEMYMKRCLAEEVERKRIETEMEAQMKAKQLANETYKMKMRELQRQRELEAEMKRQKEKIQQKLRAIGNCPMGFKWHKCGSGWRCGGGSHFVSDTQLNKSFGYDT